MESALLKATRMFSSCVELALLIGVSPQKLDNWLNKPVNIPLHYAIAIEAATERKVTWDQLVEPEVKNVMTHAQVLSKGAAYAIPCLEVAINKIKLSHNDQTTLLNDIVFDSNRPLCLDENNQLIYGFNLIESCKKQGKNKIFARRLSFIHLLKGHYGKTIENIFSLIERAPIGIALEKYLGERRGRKNVQNSAHFNVGKGIKTRRFVAIHLGFGSHFTYQQIKDVFLQGCTELIRQVDRKKITISKAAKLAKLSHKEQIKYLDH